MALDMTSVICFRMHTLGGLKASADYSLGDAVGMLWDRAMTIFVSYVDSHFPNI